ncbi:unnamed protein product, partial [Mesorhabditis spiculigera]
MSEARDVDGRRINAVTPFHPGGESGMLKNLLQEAQNQQKQQHQQLQHSYVDDDLERRKREMLEMYQSKVLQNQFASTPQIKLSSGARIQITKDRPHDLAAPPYANPAMSHSQPCLAALDRVDAGPAKKQHAPFQRCSSTEHESSSHLPNRQVGNTQKLVNSLREENLALKRQIEVLKFKTSRLQKLEAAHEKIAGEYEFLMMEKEKQDSLERQAFKAMEVQLNRLSREREMMENKMQMMQNPQIFAEQEQQLQKMNAKILEEQEQNKRLKEVLNRQSVEMQAQRTTLADQRTHINVLETALTNAQERIARKEKMREEYERPDNTTFLEGQLHKALLEKMEQAGKYEEERGRLEREIVQLRMQLTKDSGLGGIKIGSSSRHNPEENPDRFKKVISEKDKRIQTLEREIMEFQRRLHEEQEKKTSALAAVSGGLETKIKRLEDEKIDRDRRIAELTEERERLNEIIEDRGSEAARRDLNRMEEMRQKIDERRRRGRNENNNRGEMSASILVDHSPGGSPSLRTPVYEGLGYDSSSLLSQISSSSHLSGSSNQFVSSFNSKQSANPYQMHNLSHEDTIQAESGPVWNV